MGRSWPLYPLRLQERLRNYGFGGRWMTGAFQKVDLPADHTLAETWELVDRPGESSLILNGWLAGATLHEAIDRLGEDLLGSDILARFGTRFPLLIKFLDASHPLGEQIHPDDVRAASVGGFDTGKTEAWYMLHVRPGATLHAGNRPGLTREGLVASLLRRESRGCMQEYAVQPGDAFLLYAGTMHYSHGGVLFCEIMQNSDTTIGLGRYMSQAEPAHEQERAAELAGMIHIEEGFDPRTRPVRLHEGANMRTFVMACRHFCMERLDLNEPYTLPLDGQRFIVLSQIEGEATIASGDCAEVLRAGQSCLLPAGIGSITLQPRERAALLSMVVPDLQADIVRVLRARGVTDADIVGLGGTTRLNDLGRMLGML